MRRCSASDAEEDYTLSVGGGTVILRGAAGVGLYPPGLDYRTGQVGHQHRPAPDDRGEPAPAGLDAGCWLLEIGVENGEELAKHTLNPLLGVVGGISIGGFTTRGLVRPYSHGLY